MDFLYGHDRKLGYLEDEPEMVDFLDSNDIFNTPMVSVRTLPLLLPLARIFIAI